VSDVPSRILPFNPEAEMGAIGAIFLDRQALPRLRQAGLAPGDFWHPTLAAILDAACSAADRGLPVNMLTVAEEMRRLETYSKLKSMGGESYFAELMQAVVTVENLEHVADLVRDYAVRRAAIEGANRIVLAGYGSERYPGETAAELRGRVEELVQVTAPTSRRALVPMKTLLRQAIKTLEARYEAKSAITGVPTGLQRFDEMTAGLQPGELVVLAARPSMGKTALAMNAAQNAAIEHRTPVLVFSREMSKESLVERMLASEGRIDSTRFRSGFLEQRDWINLQKAAARIAQAPIDIDDTTATLEEIESVAKLWRADATKGGATPLAMVVVDYMQLVQLARRRSEQTSNRNEYVGAISRGLKQLAKDLACPVVALSQLNRSLESRSDKRPTLSDLRESGEIEQDADVIAFLYRDEVYNKAADNPDKGTAEIIIGKQRNGPIGMTRAAFLPQYTRFENLAGDRDELPAPPSSRSRRQEAYNPHARGGEG
jgi:replicative DNA helicase